MSDFLEHSDYVDVGLALNNGQTTVVVHCPSSSGGRDEACYITKRNDGTIVAFCHRCGKKGKYTPKSDEVSIEQVLDGAEKFIQADVKYGVVELNPEHGGLIKLPATLSNNWKEWPLEARSWVLKYGITSQEIRQHGLGYCDKLKRVILPCYDRGTLLGYVSRRIYKTDKYPKYLMHKQSDTKLFKKCIAPRYSNPLECVLTEDILSAIKCSRDLDSYALLGVNVHDELLVQLDVYKIAYVFLDNDNDIVKQKQLELRQKLLSVIDNVYVVESDKDPKEHSSRDLYNVIQEAITY